MRVLAAQLRHNALETTLPNYRLKLEAAATDLEVEAARVENRAWFRTRNKLVS